MWPQSSTLYNCNQLKLLFIFSHKFLNKVQMLTVVSEEHHLVSLMFGRPFCLRRRIFKSPVTAELPLTSAPLSTTYILSSKAKNVNPATSLLPPVLFFLSSCLSHPPHHQTPLLLVLFTVALHPVIFISFLFQPPSWANRALLFSTPFSFKSSPWFISTSGFGSPQR